MSLRGRTAAALGAIAGIGLLAPAGGFAATIGSDLRPAPDPSHTFECGTPSCAIVQAKLPGNPHKLRAPFSGVVTKWRLRSGYAGGEGPQPRVRLQVVRKTSSGKFRFLRHSKARHIPSSPGIYKSQTRLSVHKRDYIALDIRGAATLRGIWVDHPGALDYEWFPTPSQGDPASSPLPASNAEYLFNATVRHPRHHH